MFPKVVRGGSLERGEEGWIVCLECGDDDDDDDDDDVLQLPLSSKLVYCGVLGWLTG